MQHFLLVFFFLIICGHIYSLRCAAFSNGVSPDRLAEKDISCCRINMQCSTFTAWDESYLFTGLKSGHYRVNMVHWGISSVNPLDFLFSSSLQLFCRRYCCCLWTDKGLQVLSEMKEFWASLGESINKIS